MQPSAIFTNLPAPLSSLLMTSIEASLMGLVAVGLIAALGRKLSPRWRYAILLLVLVRLVLPVSPSSPFSVFAFLHTTPKTTATFTTQIDLRGSPTPSPSQALQPAAETPPAKPAYVTDAPKNVMAFVLLSLWVLGASVQITRSVLGYLRLRQGCKPISANSPLRGVVEQCKNEAGVRTPIELVENSSIHSVGLMGMFRPRLVLPVGIEQQFSETELRRIFQHELTHVKCGDLWINTIITVLESAHWFNPVLQWLFGRLRLERELACDSVVLKNASEPERIAYGETLLKAVQQWSSTRQPACLVGVLGGSNELRERIRAVRDGATSKQSAALGICCIAVLSVSCLTHPKVASQENPQFHPTRDNIQTVDISGTNFFMGGRKMTLDEVEAALIQTHRTNPVMAVFIRADDADQFGTVSKLLDRCERSGISNVSLATRNRDSVVMRSYLIYETALLSGLGKIQRIVPQEKWAHLDLTKPEDLHTFQMALQAGIASIPNQKEGTPISIYQNKHLGKVTYNPGEGLLVVYAPAEAQDSIQNQILLWTSPPNLQPQILIDVKFVGTTDAAAHDLYQMMVSPEPPGHFLTNSGSVWPQGLDATCLYGSLDEFQKIKPKPPSFSPVAILSSKRAAAVMEWIKKRDQIELLSGPKATTLSGRQFMIGINEQRTVLQEDGTAAEITVGPSVECLATVDFRGNSSITEIDATFSLAEFLGYDPSLPLKPILRRRQTSGKARIHDRQTVVFGGTTPVNPRNPRPKNEANQFVLGFLTITLVHPTGEPFSKDSLETFPD